MLPLASVVMAQISPAGTVKVEMSGDTSLVVSGESAGGWLPVMKISCNEITGVTDEGSHDVDYTMMTGKRLVCHNGYSSCRF